MAARNEDLRAKITTRAHCALLAHARAHGIEKPDLVSQILDDWAIRQIHGATMLARCLRAKGEAGAAEGISGATQGNAGQGAESLDWKDDE